MVAKRILIIDGDADSRSVYRILLEHHGYEVQEAEHGGDAAQWLERDRYDVVIMELTLRTVDGHALLERLRQQWADLCVIVLTARGLAQDRERAEAAGCSRYLVKPLEPQQLLREVRELTDAGKRIGE